MFVYRIVNKEGKVWRSARGLSCWTTDWGAKLAFSAIPEGHDYEIKKYALVEVDAP